MLGSVTLQLVPPAVAPVALTLHESLVFPIADTLLPLAYATFIVYTVYNESSAGPSGAAAAATVVYSAVVSPVLDNPDHTLLPGPVAVV